MKVLVLGSSGMAGHLIHQYLESRKFSVTGLSRSASPFASCISNDLENLSDWDAIFKKDHFGIIINCVGVLNQYAEQNPSRAILLNSYLPQWLADHYAESRTRIIHISTDCVFSGKLGCYRETDYRDGDTIYDRTKALGEINNTKDLTLRQSIIGPELRPSGTGLLNWFLHQSKNTINGYVNAYWNGVTTLELAKNIELAIQNNLAGLYQITSPAKTSKYELLKIIEEVFCVGVKIEKFSKAEIVDKSLCRTRQDFDYQPPDYPQQLHELRDWMAEHKSFYSHYKLNFK